MTKIRLSSQAMAGSLFDAQVATNASIQESKILFDATNGHDHDGTNSKLIANDLVWHETPTGTINGTNTLYTLSSAPNATRVQPFLNGVALTLVAAATDNDSADEFFMASGGTILTFGDPPLAAPGNPDNIHVNYETG